MEVSGGKPYTDYGADGYFMPTGFPKNPWDRPGEGIDICLWPPYLFLQKQISSYRYYS
jgi:hypothetical protein